MMSPVYRARAVQPGTAMTAHGDQVRRHCGAGPFFASGAPSDHRPGDADPALQQIYLRVTQPTANSEEAYFPTLNSHASCSMPAKNCSLFMNTRPWLPPSDLWCATFSTLLEPLMGNGARPSATRLKR